MKKIMAVVTAENLYSERFSNYVNGSGASLLRARPFPSMEAFSVYQKTHGAASAPVLLCEDILLCTDRGYDLSGTTVILLSENGKKGTLDKYRSGPELLSAVLSECADRGLSFSAENSGKELQIYAVWGAENSWKRLSFSLALTKILSHRKNTVYMDLREFSGLRCLTGRSYDRGLSTAVYYLRQGKLDGGRLMSLLEDYEGISYLPPVTSSEDTEVMSTEDRDQILRMLSEETPIEAVVADLPDLLATSPEILEKSEKIFLIGSNDPAEKESLEMFRESLRNAEREDLLKKIVDVEPEDGGHTLFQAGIDAVLYSESGDRIRRALE